VAPHDPPPAEPSSVAAEPSSVAPLVQAQPTQLQL